MANTVVDTFNVRQEVWIKIPFIAIVHARITMLCTDINNASKEQIINDTTGYTDARDNSRSILEDKILIIKSRLKTYAIIENNPVVLKQADISESKLNRMSLSTLLSTARSIAELCITNADQLQTFMITAADGEQLLELAKQTSELNAHRNTVSGQHTENTSRLDELFARLRKDFKLMDTMVDGYIDNEEFLTIYHNVRRIHDVRGRSSSK
ncbi:MAG: hypothetical protein LBV41_05145 [Cytophagaceae bacterium]|nr:hypothetical protein [Cytophagaceae bacterium]